MKLLYLTSTGNSLYVAKRLGGELISIPQAVKAGNYDFSDEKIGIVFPIYQLSVPIYVEEFLRKVKLNSDYIFAVLTYGMMDGDAAGNLEKIADECGIHFSYIRTLKMVDNFIPYFAMEKQIKTESNKQIEKHLDTIISDINNAKKKPHKSSLFGVLMNKMVKNNGAIGEGITKDLWIEDTCVQCGTCAIVCPLDNIKVQSAKPEFGTRCMSCMACTQNCPKNAIRLRNEKSKVRFRNQNISLKEIKEANK